MGRCPMQGLLSPLPVPPADPPTARETARGLTDCIRASDPTLLSLDGIDLAGALEQRLFFAQRDGIPSSLLGGPQHALLGALQLAAAAAAGLARGLVATAGAGPVVVLVRDPTHYLVVRRLHELLAEHGVPLAVARLQRAAAGAAPAMRSERLERLIDPLLVPELLRLRVLVSRRLAKATVAWSDVVGAPRSAELRRVAGRELARTSLAAAALAGLIRTWRPSVLAAFDEVGVLARLMPAAAARHGVPSLDLPHAEAVDPVAVRGAAYDRMAVYGNRAAMVLREAGIPDERIVEIGAPRFDRLVALTMTTGGSSPAVPRRIVFAAQYEGGALTRDVLAACLRGAMAVAGAVAPSDLVIVPHPAAPPGSDAATTPDRIAPGVTVKRAGRHELHGVLPGAWAMVTGWSNSVFEAAIAGVPAITVDPGGVVPRDYAAEGLAVRARDETSAAEVARGLLADGARRAAIDRARAALQSRIGPIDGHATERAAAIVLELRSAARASRASPDRGSSVD